MFQKTSSARIETLTNDTPKAPAFWGFRRRAPRQTAESAAPAAADESAFTPDATGYGFETFGRGGLQLGGLHRDQQWVGAWGGRC